MPRFDRLSALLARFELQVVPAARGAANLTLFSAQATGEPLRIVFCPRGGGMNSALPDETAAFRAEVIWGGNANPLLSALPERIEIGLENSRDLVHVARLLLVESLNPRCGGGTVMNRLGEVLMVHLLRGQIEQGAASPGLLGGLADPRLSRVLVAVHEEPGRAWTNRELAGIAGLSLSRFAELFAARVGETPMAYVRRWRMVLARRDAEKGERVQTIARRYGYGSGEALSRAFRREFDTNAVSLRKNT